MQDADDNFSKKVCESIWNAIQFTDQSPEKDFVEVYFGIGAPWDGNENNSFMYQLSSIRNDALVLISQNSCKTTCNDFFPRCYRFGNENLCGQSYVRSLDGLRTALRDIEVIHRKSPAKYQPIFAVLAIYDETGKEDILYTWTDIENPLVRCASPLGNARSGSEFSQWWNHHRTLIYILIGVLGIIFVVFIVSLLTKKNRVPVSAAEKAADEKALEKEIEDSERNEEKRSWIGLPGTESPSTI